MTAPFPASVELNNVVKEYDLGQVKVTALRNIDLTIERGEFTTIAGPSGSGKTTMLNLIGCVDRPTRGVVEIAGTVINDLSDAKLTKLRLFKLGFIFQSFNLVPVLNVFQNVELPLLLQGMLSAKERRAKVEDLVDRVGLSPQIKQRPAELSGGQRQRVAIARALIHDPEIVLADEPTANLDTENSLNIIEIMRKMNRENHTTFIFSTHDPTVMNLADRIVKLVDGHIQQPEEAEAPASA